MLEPCMSSYHPYCHLAFIIQGDEILSLPLHLAIMAAETLHPSTSSGHLWQHILHQKLLSGAFQLLNLIGFHCTRLKLHWMQVDIQKYKSS